MRLPRAKLTVRRMMILVAVFAGVFWMVMLDLRRSQRINAPDIIDVEVASALPGRPITGQRLVRPDGTISLGYYGTVYVAGLMPREARTKIVGHLRSFLSDEALGLVDPVRVADGTEVLRRAAPDETDRVSVDVSTKNAREGVLNRIGDELRRLWSRL